MARGRLRIYLGAAPGVGKTFAMLNEGRRRHTRGTDVVVGLVETHGRENTAAQVADARGHAPSPRALPRPRLRRDGRRRHHRPPPRPGPRRRAGAHQRAWLEEREALAGRRRDPRRRHRRHLDAEHPAPRIGERPRRAHHRREAARDDPRREGSGRRPGRARRHDTRGAAPADGARQHLPLRARGLGAGQLLPAGQPRRPPRAGAALGRRPGRRIAPAVHGGPRDRHLVGDPRACRRRARPARDKATTSSDVRRAWRNGPAATCSACTSATPAGSPRRGTTPASPSTASCSSRSAAPTTRWPATTSAGRSSSSRRPSGPRSW